MTYVISDIHGEYDLFMQMLNKIEFSDNDTMWVLGDVVDRGDFPIKTLMHIINSDNIYMILGNHEEFMIDFFNRNTIPRSMSKVYEMTDYEMWFSNGGIETIKDLQKLDSEVMDLIIQYLKELPLVKNISINNNNFYLAHANLSLVNGSAAVEQNRDFILWQRRRPSTNDMLKNNEYLITGHTITRNFGTDDTIFKSHNWLCIDCGAVFTGKLGCLRLDDFKEFYVTK